MVSHVRAWRAFQRQEFETEEFDYRRRQFRRPDADQRHAGPAGGRPAGGHRAYHLAPLRLARCLFYCLAMIVVVFLGRACWPLVDAWATKHHYGRLRHQCLVEKLKLEAEIRRIQAVKGNGEMREKS